MKNIHVLPTDKPSRLCYVIWTEESILTVFEDEMEKGRRIFPQNIYITNDEEIKEGDWGLFSLNDITEIVKVTTIINNAFESKKGFGYGLEYCQKIILTTDQDLIKAGVQAIDEEFLEWFVNNPSCEFVKAYWYEGIETGHYYRIDIPKEERCICEVGHPYNNAACKIHGGYLNKQTVQEYEQQGLEKYSHELEPKQETTADYIDRHIVEAMVELAKQKRMYSEEEVFNLCREFAIFVQRNRPSYKKQQEWFEQFKKK